MDENYLIKKHKGYGYDEVEIAENVFKLSLREKQKEIIREFFTKNEDGKPKYEEFMLVCGKKGGKTFLTATINLILVYKWLLMDDPFKKFGIIPQDVYLLNTCAGKDQSIKVYLNQVKGIITLSNFLQYFLAKDPVSDEVHFKIRGNDKFHLVLKAQSSRSTSSLGFLCFSVTFDELAWFQDSNNKTSSKETYGALFPNIKPFGGWGYSFILSSPSDTGSWFYSHYEFARQSVTKLVKQYSTWIMNPNITRESLNEEFRRDPDKATMDYGGEFIEAYGGAFHPEIIERAISINILDISIPDKRQRVIALDPGLRKDAYALAMGYIDVNFNVYIDYVKYWMGTRTVPVRISDVEEHIKFLYKNFKISKIVLDQRYSASTIQRLSEEGMPIYETFFDGGYKQRIYQTFKEKINMNEIFLPRDEKVKNELIALRRKGTGANIKYEAPTSGPVKSDDMADAIVNCVYQLALLNDEGAGTDDFVLDGERVLLDEASIKKQLENMTDKQKERRTNEIKRQKELEEKLAKQVQEQGGFIVG